MRFAMRTRQNRTALQHSTALSQAISRLRELADEMRSDGLDEEAASLETTIRDLHWQYEDLIDQELAAEWPNGPRRPVRAPLIPIR
jgi:hypothetical protein